MNKAEKLKRAALNARAAMADTDDAEKRAYAELDRAWNGSRGAIGPRVEDLLAQWHHSNKRAEGAYLASRDADAALLEAVLEEPIKP